jgi:hypothetical protein
MEYNTINPKAFSAPDTIKGIMGNTVANPAVPKTIDPLTGLPLNSTIAQDASLQIPTPQPTTQQITPAYGLNQ